MATILTKRSNTASSVPVAGDLTNSTGGAELAVNTADKRLFTKDSGGTVVELGTNPSSVTLPNGTANGVPYLNGSKVLTSGSALTFDGTLFKVAGFADFSTSNTTCRISSNATSAYVGDNSIGNGTGFGFNSPSAYLYFQTYGSEQMRLTSTGLGIGTSSPGYKLDVNGIANIGGGVLIGGAVSDSSYTATANSGSAKFGINATGPYIYTSAALALQVYTNNTERARIDSSGNFILGATAMGTGGVTGMRLNSAAANGLTFAASGTDKGFVYLQPSGTKLQLETASGYTINVVSSSNGVTLANGGTSWGSLSDERKKDIIEPIVDAAAKVSTLRAVIGKYKTDDGGTRRSFLIAQDVRAILPEAVVEDASGDLILQYTDTIPLLVAAIQEQQAIINAQGTALNQLKARLDAANL